MEGRFGMGSVVFEEGPCGLCGFTCDLNCKYFHVIRRSLSFAQTDGCLLTRAPLGRLSVLCLIDKCLPMPHVSFLFVMEMEKFDLQLQLERCISTHLLALMEGDFK